MKVLRLVALLFLPLLAFGSVTSQTDKTGPFTITGLPLTIPVGFPFQQGSDLVVLDEGSAGTPRDPAAVLALGSDYVVTGGGYNGANQMQTGSITVASGGANLVLANDLIVIMRGVPINQTTSFSATGPLTINLIEQALDKMATLSQQVNEIGSRSLQFENFEFLSPTLSLTSRKSMLLGFDANGNVEFYPVGGGGGGGVTQLLAGTNITLSPAGGTGEVTINATGGGGGITGPGTSTNLGIATWNGTTGAALFSPAFDTINTSTGLMVLSPSGANGLNIFGQNGFIGMTITGASNTGGSNGLFLQAGTNTSDYALKAETFSGTVGLIVDGSAHVRLPQLLSQGTIGTDSSGNIVAGSGGSGVTSLTSGTGITLSPSTITSTGSIAFNTGASLTLTGVHTYNAGSFVPLVVNAFNGFGGETINGSSTASGSFGLSIAAGTNTSDFPLQITNQAGSATGEFIRGDMQVSFPHSLSSAGLVQTTSGGVISAFAFGTNGQVLGTTGSAFQWVSSLSNPMSAVGDIIVGGTSGAATRLAAGSNGQVLELSGGTPTWQTVTGTGTVTHSVGALTSGAIVIGNGGGDVQVAAPTISSNTITSASSTDLTLSSNGTTQNVNLDAFGTTGNVNAINTSAHANINIQSTAATSTSNTDYLQFTLNDSVGLINSAFISSAFTNTTRATDASYINFNNWVGGSFGEAARVSSPGNFLVGTTSDTGVVGPGMIKSSTTAAANTMVLETTSAVATSNGGQFLFRLNDSAGLVNAATIGFGIDSTTHASDTTHITFNTLVGSSSLSEVGRFSAPGNFLVGTTSDSGLTGSGGGLIVNNGALVKGYLQTSFAGTVGALNIAGSTSNPSLPVEGDIWENKTSHHFFGYLNGTVTQIDGGGGGGGSFPISPDTYTQGLISLSVTTPTANTEADELVLTTAGTASAANQFYSGAVHYIGSGWKTTATAAAEPVEVRNFLVPVQGGTVPTMNMEFDMQVNTGGWNNFFNITPGVSTGVTLSPGSGGSLTMTSGGSMNLTAGSGNALNLGGGGTGSIMSIGNTSISAIQTISTTVIGKTFAVKSGTNAKAGTFTLVSGVATVSDTSIDANSVVMVTVKTVSGTRTGNPDIVPTAGTGFVATELGGTSDNSTYNFVVLEVN